MPESPCKKPIESTYQIIQPTQGQTITDSRIFGSWQSDRLRTFRHFKPAGVTKPSRLILLKKMFGKLIVNWGRRRYSSQLAEHKENGHYEILAKDDCSVVIKTINPKIPPKENLLHIHFHDKDHYWIAISGNLIEWFKRIKAKK